MQTRRLCTLLCGLSTERNSKNRGTSPNLSRSTCNAMHQVQPHARFDGRRPVGRNLQQGAQHAQRVQGQRVIPPQQLTQQGKHVTLHRVIHQLIRRTCDKSCVQDMYTQHPCTQWYMMACLFSMHTYPVVHAQPALAPPHSSSRQGPTAAPAAGRTAAWWP